MKQDPACLERLTDRQARSSIATWSAESRKTRTACQHVSDQFCHPRQILPYRGYNYCTLSSAASPVVLVDCFLTVALAINQLRGPFY